MEHGLIEKAKAGDEHAFRILIESYHVVIFHTVYAVLRNQKDAEDATQEVFLKIYLSLSRYENQGFKTWISRIAVNHAIDMKRKAYRKREAAVEDHVIEDNPNSMLETREQSVEDQITNQEIKKLVHQRIHELPTNHQEIIHGFYIEEKSYEQLASDLKITRDTVATKLHRARTWMRKNWKESDFL